MDASQVVKTPPSTSPLCLSREVRSARWVVPAILLLVFAPALAWSATPAPPAPPAAMPAPPAAPPAEAPPPAAAASSGASAGDLIGPLTSQSVELDQALSSALAALEKKVRETVATWPKTAKPDEAEKVKNKLLEDWDDQATPLADDFKAHLLSSDQDLLTKLGVPSQLEGSLSQQMRSSRDGIVTAITEGLKKGRSQVQDLKSESTAEQASAKVEMALATAHKESVKASGEKLGVRNEALVAQSGGGLAAEVARQSPLLQKFKEDDDSQFLQQFSRETGLSKVIRCSWMDVPKRLRCLPQALLVSADDISEIHIYDLPVGKKVRVEAFTTGDKLPRTSPTSPSSPDECGQENQLACDVLTIDTKHGREAVIAVYKDRLFKPLYGGTGLRRRTGSAAKVLRKPDRQRLAILCSGAAQEIFVNVSIEPESREDDVRSIAVPIAYKRWGVETGAFFAFTTASDEELVFDPANQADGKRKVTGRRNTDSYSQQTGIFLSIFPRNYPAVGLGLGFHADSGRSASVYFGPTFRLRSLGEHGLATFSFGAAAVPLRRFPGVVNGNSYAADSADLQGKVQTVLKPYVLINLGFSFGPIDSAAQTGR